MTGANTMVRIKKRQVLIVDDMWLKRAMWRA
jgi:hypothetical protein